MIKELPNTIEEYIANCAPEIQPLLHDLRHTILKAAKNATEKISWGMATFVYHGNLVHFSSEKKHIGFHPTPSAILAFQEELTDYPCSKGTIQFSYEKPLPLDLIYRIVLFRVQEQETKEKEKKEGKKEEKILRPRHSMPDDIKQLLLKEDLLNIYNSRPPYQKNDYLAWILTAKRAETRAKRLNQMIEELKCGTLYMGRPYSVKK